VSYAAEPYSQFVEDLLTALTGGVIRERFIFTTESEPFRLSPPAPLLKSTLTAFGLSGGAYARFRQDVDFGITADWTVQWKAQKDGTPAAGAVWPDPGTPFFVNYEYKRPPEEAPPLTDRTPGSVTRLMAESFAREYAVLSKQLEGVYRAGFLDTAEGRDLDQLVALLGLSRRDRTYAAGIVLLSRATPAPADVFVPAGFLLSTGQPPPVTFETTEDRTLRRGSLSIEVPVRALQSGLLGVVDEGAITVIHRSILGIEAATNAQPTALSGATESDEALRGRARRALETSGRATTGALLGALATVPGVREKDVRIDEDHLQRPGVITLNVAVALDAQSCARVIDVIEQTRPAGVRVLHNLDCDSPVVGLTPPPNQVDDADEPQDSVSGSGLFFPGVVAAVLLPAAASLSAQDRAALKSAGEKAVAAVAADAGVGEALIYNRLIEALMSIEGVLDVQLELYPAGAPASGSRHRNLLPPRTLRVSLDPAEGGAFTVQVGGELVALDVTVQITLKGAGTLGDQVANTEDARMQIVAQLRDGVGGLSQITLAALSGLLAVSESYDATIVSYQADYVDAGVRVHPTSPTLSITDKERPFVRSVMVAGGGA
jgi:uncharacterized phage protein gp47/JayE